MCVENQNGEGAGKTNLSSILTSYFYQYPHAMFITDRDGTIEYINPVFENLSGYKRNELIGKNPKVFQSGTHGSEFYEELWKTILSGKEYEGDFLNRNGSGETISWKERITPLRDETGNISNFLCRVDLPSNGSATAISSQGSFVSTEAVQSGKIRESLFPKLQKEYGLTYQEAKICELLVAGQTRDNLVRQLGVHSGTLKNHLKAIYRKTIEKDLEEPGQGRDKLQRLTMFLIRLC
ncbi:PAS domain-containing protein [Leptospira kmetyi]|uniref:Histidine kinase n=1 Tax=Leptospira kmetyi TaxID=408139 RepID=A0A2M9XSE8_9LEPT|nr:PAS domain-containing protein [Leptospira kmetyi]AYV56486.1 PAS domain-containing protein [Leptospira kmetyi]EQA55198.1 PAS domain S-box protein [Leptospira kmetyi serovar Malaysia str. Bejo-Iso9]PJZ30663.1 histidine kinase [Leptospira kmetyi]PJZ42242.1 histidine kinase [Leptospira kmetyi]TGK17659.1 PAS domain-containing protein [Leptospira kmetyi]